MDTGGGGTATIEAAAIRLATLLTAGGEGPAGPGEPGLDFEPVIEPCPLAGGPMPEDVWAVDGGQAIVADARCLQVVVTRTARVRLRRGECVLQEAAPLRAYLLGGAESRSALDQLGLPLPATTAMDANLVRDRWEWEAVERCVDEADEGALVLVDGDLWPDWRIPASYVGSLLERATHKGVLVVGVTKHSSLARNGAPLLGQLEVEAQSAFGARARWWAALARSRPPEPEEQQRPELAVQVVAARLDPAARFAFRIDLPAATAPDAALGAVVAVSDDAGFPGYPYPLAVADGLAACPHWVRQEAALALDELLAEAGVDVETRERAFADRHRLMERA
jgi:hypothetical protein